MCKQLIRPKRHCPRHIGTGRPSPSVLHFNGWTLSPRLVLGETVGIRIQHSPVAEDRSRLRKQIVHLVGQLFGTGHPAFADLLQHCRIRPELNPPHLTGPGREAEPASSRHGNTCSHPALLRPQEADFPENGFCHFNGRRSKLSHGLHPPELRQTFGTAPHPDADAQ